MTSTATIRYATAGGAETHAIHTGEVFAWQTYCTGCTHTAKQNKRTDALKDAQSHATDCAALPQDTS